MATDQGQDLLLIALGALVKQDEGGAREAIQNLTAFYAGENRHDTSETVEEASQRQRSGEHKQATPSKLGSLTE